MGWYGEGVERYGGRTLIADPDEMDVGLGREARIIINVAPC